MNGTAAFFFASDRSLTFDILRGRVRACASRHGGGALGSFLRIERLEDISHRVDICGLIPAHRPEPSIWWTLMDVRSDVERKEMHDVSSSVNAGYLAATAGEISWSSPSCRSGRNDAAGSRWGQGVRPAIRWCMLLPLSTFLKHPSQTIAFCPCKHGSSHWRDTQGRLMVQSTYHRLVPHASSRRPQGWPGSV